MINLAENSPLVSVIVVTYNSSKYVLETLESVKEQTYKNIELIVSDDSSTDDTVRICRKWINENKSMFSRTELLTSKKNTGTPSNCNRGIKESRGGWIKLIAGDDALMPYCIEEYIKFIIKNPHVKFIHSDVYEYDYGFSGKNKRNIQSYSNFKINKPGISAQEQFNILLRVNMIRSATVMMNKSIFYECGYFDETLKYLEDRPMWLRITNNNIKLHYIDIVAAKYRRYGETKIGKDKIYARVKRSLQKEKYILRNYFWYFTFSERLKKLLIFIFYFNSYIYFQWINKSTSNRYSKFVNRIYFGIENRMKKLNRSIENKYKN